jgi:hypothetical protein
MSSNEKEGIAVKEEYTCSKRRNLPERQKRGGYY